SAVHCIYLRSAASPYSGPSHRSAACCSSLAGYAWSSASSNCKLDGGIIISKNNGFTHYLLIFLLFMAVFAAGSGIVNLITTQTISIGEIVALLGLLAALAIYMKNRLVKRNNRIK